MLRTYRDEFWILLIGIILFIPFLGASHLFDWDEINFAEAAREMIVSGNYLQVQIHFQPFWEKPPLFFWLQVLSMKIFGINEFAARFPNAVCGMITLIVLFRIGKKLKDRKFGWLWVMCFGGSLLPMVYFKSGIIDPVFNLFIFIALYYFILYIKNNHRVIDLFYAGIFTGLAVLTKGPASVVVLGLCFLVYYLLQRFRSFLPVKHIFYYIGFILLVLVPWLAMELIQNGTWFIWAFTKYQFQLASSDVAGHKGFFGYHFIVVFFFCLPASIFAIPSLFRIKDTDNQFNQFRKWMLILFWVVIILFSLIQTKIPHYSSLTYLPLSFLAATTIYHLKSKWSRWFSAGLILCMLPCILILVLFPWISNQPERLEELLNDPNLLSGLTTRVSVFSGYESLVGAGLFIALIVSLFMNTASKAKNAVLFLFISSAILINIAIIVFIPKVEYYSQQPVINFLVKHKDENCYLTVTGFKSYAHLFYGEAKPDDTSSPQFREWLDKRRVQLKMEADWPAPDEFQLQFNIWLLFGQIEKPAYFIIKSNAIENMLEHYPSLSLYKEEGPYAFLIREIPNQNK